MLSIKQVADKLNLTEHTIRYYCDQGLVPSVQRNQRNERIFNDDAVEWLYGCKMLRQAGLSIKNLRKYIQLCLEGSATIDQRYQIMLDEKQKVIQKLNDAQKNLSFLNQKIKMYQDAKKQLHSDPLNPKQ